MAKKKAKKKTKVKKGKKKLTPAQKREKKLRREMYEIIFINGKQKRVRRTPPEPDWSEIDNPIFFTQNEMWEELHAWEERQNAEYAKDNVPLECSKSTRLKDDELPF